MASNSPPSVRDDLKVFRDFSLQGLWRRSDGKGVDIGIYPSRENS
jgi:hypothetical protein